MPLDTREPVQETPNRPGPFMARSPFTNAILHFHCDEYATLLGPTDRRQIYHQAGSTRPTSPRTAIRHLACAFRSDKTGEHAFVQQPGERDELLLPSTGGSFSTEAGVFCAEPE